MLIRIGISAQHVFYKQENKAKQQNAGVVFPVFCNYTSGHNSKKISVHVTIELEEVILCI